MLQGLRVDTDFVEFQQLREVGVFSYLIYYLVNSHFNGWGFVKAWMVVFLVPSDLEQVRKSLVWS